MIVLNSIALATLLLVFAANLVVTFAVARSHYYNKKQKTMQTSVVWLLPILGALGVGVFLYSQRDNPTFNTREYPEPHEKAVAVTVQDSVHGGQPVD